MSSMPNAAKLPARLMNPPRRELKDLDEGETGYISRSSMAVTPDADCYLDPTAGLEKRECGMIRVDRREDGYHVTVISRGQKWNAYPIHEEKGVPVASVTEDYDPEMDDPILKLRGMK
jgi:hypothetical protein